MFQKSNFNPAWWLKNRHGQTMLAKLLRKSESVDTKLQTLETPDGDFIDLAWTEIPDNTEKPIVVVLHGLEGSKDSHYAKGMLGAIQNNGWTGLLMHFRGCSGRPNRQASAYHSGDTRDITFLTKYLNEHYPENPKAIIGFSLGGNVLVNYLAQQPSNQYKAATVICAPLDLASCSQQINTGSSKIYQKYLLDMLKDSTLIKHQAKLLPDHCPEKVKAIETMWQFDDYVTAPINGFTDAQDYYTQVSGLQFLNQIQQQCLIIHAKDDPFLNHQAITNIESLNTNIHFEISEHGGHVGFVTGNNPFKPIFWLEQRVPDYLKQYL